VEMLMKDIIEHVSEPAKHVVDALSILTVLGTLVEILPAIAALLSIVWSLLRIYESKTVQRWLGKKDAINE
jgi:hypothetical protein